jgi:hypothetical protein
MNFAAEERERRRVRDALADLGRALTRLLKYSLRDLRW